MRLIVGSVLLQILCLSAAFTAEVGWLTVDEPVTGAVAARYRQALDVAVERGFKLMVIELDASDGEWAAARDLARHALDHEAAPALAIWVTGNAVRQAALIAYAHPRIYATPSATLGAMSEGGEDARSLAIDLRQLLDRAATQHGWSYDALRAMVDPAPTLYRYAGAEGAILVDDDRCERFERDHPDLDEPEEVVASDRVWTAAGRELAPLGMVTGLATDRTALLAALDHAGATVVDLPAAATTDTAETRAPPPPAEEYGQVGFIDISDVDDNDMIDDYKAAYLDRALADARDQGLDTVVVKIDTNGGYLHSGRRMMKSMLDQSVADGPRMVAWIQSHAISAGAMIAYGCSEIYITPSANIGDIGVIMVGPDGTMEYGPEKIETVVREVLRLGHDVNGWDEALLRKMTARNQKLYQYRHPDGRRVYVLEEDVPAYEADHPEIDPDDPRQKVQILGEDKLLTYTGTNAVADGMATALVDTRADLFTRLGTSAEAVTMLLPDPTERIAWALAAWAPILASLGVLFIIFELKTPGVGLFALLGALCFSLFFICQYYLQMAGYLEIILIVLGVGLVLADVFSGFGGGFLAAGGAVLGIVGLVLAFMADTWQFDPSSFGFAADLGRALIRSTIALVLIVVGMAILITTLPHSRLGAHIAVQGEITATSGDGQASMIGRTGRALCALHPGGTVLIGDESLSARTEHGEYIPASSMVEVVRMGLGELVVRVVDDQSAEDAT